MKKLMELFLLVFILLLFKKEVDSISSRPIIGVIAQMFKVPPPGVQGTSYISASYVKFLEGAGARVVPIPTKITNLELAKLITRLNGALFPGGDANLADSPYKRLAEYVYRWAVDEFHDGGYFPIWGTGLGMQTLLTLTSGTDKVISPSVGTWDKSMRLILTASSDRSKLFTNMLPNVRAALEELATTYNVHYNCVSIETFTTTNESKTLQKFFKVLSTNTDANGKKFVSTIEGHDYPFYGVQWHPEMNIFEFNVKEGEGDNINHSQDAIQASQYMANFFVSEARKNDNRFPDKETEERYLIYNYKPFYSAEKGWFDEEIYAF